MALRNPDKGRLAQCFELLRTREKEDSLRHLGSKPWCTLQAVKHCLGKLPDARRRNCLRPYSSGDSANGAWHFGLCPQTRELQNPQALGTHQKAGLAKWWRVIRAAEIKVE